MTPPRERIERVFMACSANDEKAPHHGPFTTAEEAEVHTIGQGWEWVLVYTNVFSESGHVTDVQKRFYQPARRMSAAEIKRILSTPDMKPLNAEETEFFAEYEKQMQPEPAPRINIEAFKEELRKRRDG